MTDENDRQVGHRLDRIEKKIDDLAQAFVILARTEEKVLNMESQRVSDRAHFDKLCLQHEKDMEKLSSRIDILSEKMNSSTIGLSNTSLILGGISKAFWLVIGAGVTYIVSVINTTK